MALKDKLKGRNFDISSKDMFNYQLMKEELEKNRNQLDLANKKSVDLDDKSATVEKIIKNLKQIPIKKDNYILNKNDRSFILSYINNVNQTNKEYKNMKLLSVTLNNVENELNQNKNKIKQLSNSNDYYSRKVKNLSEKIKNQENTINELEQEKETLIDKLNFWKNKFLNIIEYIKRKLFSKSDRDTYYEMSVDLYNNNTIDHNTFYDLKDDYEYSKRNDYRKKDDLER